MAGKTSNNPMDIHRRQQRKKEIQKNKTKRISIRDTIVAETKSIQSIQNEIYQLEKQQQDKHGSSIIINNKNDRTQLDSKKEIQKLQRLQKELKIVQKAQEQRIQKANEQRQIQYEQQQKLLQTKKGIDQYNEKKFKYSIYSIYYDSMLNPYGAPPPGQPMFYKKKGGGKTRKIYETDIPHDQLDVDDYEEMLKQQQQQQRMMYDRNSRNNDRLDVAGDNGTNNNKHNNNYQHHPSSIPMPPPPPPPPPLHNIPPPPPPPPQPPLEQSIPPPPPPPPPELPLPPKIPTSDIPPPPPPPSKAVQLLNNSKRSKKKKHGTCSSSSSSSVILNDIWASQEEIEYESLINNGTSTMEGQLPPLHQQQHQQQQKEQFDFKNNKKRKKEHESDNYDPLCPTAQGYEEYRDQDLIQRSSTTDIQQKNKKMKKKQEHDNNANQQRKNINWYYLDQSNVIQGPFQATQMIMWKEAGFFPLDTLVRVDEVGNEEFHPISIFNLTTGEKINNSCDDNDNIDRDSGIEDRIAMLRGERNIGIDNSTEALESNDSVIEDRIAALKKDREIGVEDRIAALKGDNTVTDETNEVEFKTLEDNIAHTETKDIEYSTIEASQLSTMDSTNQYTDLAVGAYPLEQGFADDDNMAEEVPYPTDVAYPIDDDVYAYPDTDAAYDNNDDDNEVAPYYYYVENESSYQKVENGDEESNEKTLKQAKKKFDGDKSLVGFVPSHLQVRRKKR